MAPIEIREFLDDQGRSPVKKWFSTLGSHAATRINKYVERLSEGNFSNAKSVGRGVSELRVDFGPGYRVYFGWGGGTKKTTAAGYRRITGALVRI